MYKKDFDRLNMVSPNADSDSPPSSASERKNLIKSTGLSPVLKKKLAIGIPIAIIGGAVVITGVMLLAYYLASLDLITYNGFCMSDMSCGSNMVCNSGSCGCSSGLTWNSSYCVNSTSTNKTNATTITATIVSPTTNVTTAMSRVINMFTGTTYTTTSITTYGNGTPISLSGPPDLFPINTSQIYYVVPDNGNFVLIFYDENGTYIKHQFFLDVYYVTYYNNFYYLTTYASSNGHVHKYDSGLQWVASYFVGAVNLFGIEYNIVADYLYVCDYSSGIIRAFDKNLNLNTTASISLGGVLDVISYQGYLYATSTSNIINIYRGTTLLVTYSSVCKSNYAHNMYMHQDTGYFFLSCYWDKKIYMWYTNGTQAFFTGLYLNTAGNPRGVGVDSYGRVIVSMVSPNRVDIFKI